MCIINNIVTYNTYNIYIYVYKYSLTFGNEPFSKIV